MKCPQQGVPSDARDETNTSPLFVAAQGGHDRIVKALLDDNADPNSRETTLGRPTLYVAAYRFWKKTCHNSLKSLLTCFSLQELSKDCYTLDQCRG